MSDDSMTSGYPPYPAPPDPAHQPPAYPWSFVPLRAPSGLATATIVLAVVWTLAQLACAIAVWPAADEYSYANAIGLDSYYVWTAYDTFNLLQVPAMIAVYVVACVWLFKARTVAQALSPGVPHVRGSAWVWLGWWVPIVSFWFPYQVVRDVRRGSRLPDSDAVGLWWAAWLGLSLTSIVVQVLMPDTGYSDGDLLAAWPWAETVHTVVMVSGLFLWIRVVRGVNRAQLAILGG